MKTYNLKIAFEERNIGIEEKATEGITIVEARLVVAILEEYKQKMISYIMFSQNKQETDKKQ